MMLCIDGAEIDALTFALTLREGDVLRVLRQGTVSRTLGNELALLEDFLASQRITLTDITSFGLVCGPGSAGALRSTLSLINTCALVHHRDVFPVQRSHEHWSLDGHAKPYALPIYDRPAHTTPSVKDALGRRI